MIKIAFVFKRLPQLSQEEFRQYGWGNHASLVRQHAATLGMQRCVQAYRIDDPLNEALRVAHGAAEPYDGMASMYWKDYEDFIATSSREEAQLADQVFKEDEGRFIDVARSSQCLATEQVIIGGDRKRIVATVDSPAITLVHSFCRLPGQSLEECQGYWWETHGPLLRQHAAALGVVRYVQSHRIDDPLNEVMQAMRGTMEPFDGISQLWWKDRRDLERSMSTREGQQAWKQIREDEQHFMDTSRSSLWLAKENIALGQG
ncbi:MAG: hypothetical protein FJ012_00075 [Chloroflexi bacterium]|nr:hypothetical protein [Chloroflexota bacterium]